MGAYEDFGPDAFVPFCLSMPERICEFLAEKAPTRVALH